MKLPSQTKLQALQLCDSPCKLSFDHTRAVQTAKTQLRERDDSGEDYTELENDEEISEVDVEEFEDRKSTFLKLSWEMDA